MNVVVIFDGIAYGMLLFLLSAGLSVTMGLMNFVNLAHGMFAMVGGYTAIVAMRQGGLGFFSALPLAFVVAALAGALLERLLFRRLYQAHALDQVLLSVGLVFVAVALATYGFGSSLQTIELPALLQGRLSIAGLELGRYRLFLIIVGALLSVALWLAASRTRYGAMVRAAVDQPHVAGALGMNVSRLFVLTFSLGAGLAGLGGALGLELLGMEPGFALKYMVYFLLVVCTGGAGTLSGPFVAALVIGVADMLGKYYVPQVGGFLIYLLMVVMLLWRPQGLLARQTGMTEQIT